MNSYSKKVGRKNLTETEWIVDQKPNKYIFKNELVFILKSVFSLSISLSLSILKLIVDWKTAAYLYTIFVCCSRLFVESKQIEHITLILLLSFISFLFLCFFFYLFRFLSKLILISIYSLLSWQSKLAIFEQEISQRTVHNLSIN